MTDDLSHIEDELRSLAVPIEQIHEDPSNVRVHPTKNMRAIVASLRKFGQQKPIVISQGGGIIAGNGTYLAAQELGWTHLAAVRSSLDGANAADFGVADNRTAELAEWDMGNLEARLTGFSAERDIEALGFSEEDVTALFGTKEPDQEDQRSEGSEVGEAYKGVLSLTVFDMEIRTQLRERIVDMLKDESWTEFVEID